LAPSDRPTVLSLTRFSVWQSPRMMWADVFPPVQKFDAHGPLAILAPLRLFSCFALSFQRVFCFASLIVRPSVYVRLKIPFWPNSPDFVPRGRPLLLTLFLSFEARGIWWVYDCHHYSLLLPLLFFGQVLVFGLLWCAADFVLWCLLFLRGSLPPRKGLGLAALLLLRVQREVCGRGSMLVFPFSIIQGLYFHNGLLPFFKAPFRQSLHSRSTSVFFSPH